MRIACLHTVDSNVPVLEAAPRHSRCRLPKPP